MRIAEAGAATIWSAHASSCATIAAAHSTSASYASAWDLTGSADLLEQHLDSLVCLWRVANDDQTFEGADFADSITCGHPGLRLDGGDDRIDEVNGSTFFGVVFGRIFAEVLGAAHAAAHSSHSSSHHRATAAAFTASARHAAGTAGHSATGAHSHLSEELLRRGEDRLEHSEGSCAR